MKSDANDAQSIDTAPEPASEPSPAPTESAVEQAPHPSAALVDTWFTKHFHNMSALYDERAYVHLLSAKEDLKVSLATSV